MNISRKAWITIVGVALFGLWWGVPTLNQWQADNLVDELCAKDGGVKLYETVMLPKERFNQWGQFAVSSERFLKPSDEYYTTWKTTKIIGDPDSSDWKLTVYQHHFVLYRVADKKILGESTGYARRGGDPIGPWHPSSHACPGSVKSRLVTQVFLKSTNAHQ
jgi:hypothetical protein